MPRRIGETKRYSRKVSVWKRKPIGRVRLPVFIRFSTRVSDRIGRTNFFGFTKRDLTLASSWKRMRNGNQPPPYTRNSRPRVERVRTKLGNDSIVFALSTFCDSDSRNRLLFVLVFRPRKADHIYMTTVIKPHGLCGWSIRCATVAISVAFCASAFAAPNKSVATSKQQPVLKGKR